MKHRPTPRTPEASTIHAAEEPWVPRYPAARRSAASDGSDAVLTRTLTHYKPNLFDEPELDPEVILQAELVVRRLAGVPGVLGVAVVDASSGDALACHPSSASHDIRAAARSGVTLMRLKGKVLSGLGLEDDAVEDVVITFARRYHLIRPARQDERFVLFVSLDRGQTNLAIARNELAQAADGFAP